MHTYFKRYRYSVVLLKQLIQTDFRLRYQGSVLGYMWSLLRPLFLFVTLYLVFGVFLKAGEGVPHYGVYLLLGIVLWNYFIEVTTGNVSAVVGKGDLIRKINFPKYVIVLAGCASALINLTLNFMIIAIFMFVFGVDIGLSAILVLPLLIELTIFAVGVAFFLSAAFVRFRDIGYIWEVLVQAAFYATPILYPLTPLLVPESIQKILILNPVAQIIQDMRYVLITPETTIISDLYSSKAIWLIPLSIVVIITVASAAYFRQRSKYFAEEV